MDKLYISDGTQKPLTFDGSVDKLEIQKTPKPIFIKQFKKRILKKAAKIIRKFPPT